MDICFCFFFSSFEFLCFALANGRSILKCIFIWNSHTNVTPQIEQTRERKKDEYKNVFQLNKNCETVFWVAIYLPEKVICVFRLPIINPSKLLYFAAKNVDFLDEMSWFDRKIGVLKIQNFRYQNSNGKLMQTCIHQINNLFSILFSQRLWIKVPVFFT